jgi:hypothetical protein
VHSVYYFSPFNLYLLLCSCQEACLPGAQRLSTSNHTCLWESPISLSKIWNPSSSFEWQSATLQLPRGLPPKVHRSPVLSTVPDSGRAPTPLSESRNARFPIERWKAVTCYLVGSARMPASPRCTEAQHFPLHLPAGESCLSCGRA